MAAENTLRYVKVDYLAHKDALLQRVRSRWSTSWNDFTANNLAMMFVDLISWSTATLAYTVNQLASENFVTTMKLRESAVRLGALVGYQLRGPVPSSLLCEATIPAAIGQTVKISKGTLVRAGAASIPFEVAQDYLIAGDARSPETLVATLSSSLSGSKILSTDLSVVFGSANVDAVDTTIDLRQYISAGQAFSILPSDGKVYTVQAVESSPGAVSYNRLVINPVYAGSTNSATSGKVVDRRILLVQGQTMTDRFVTPATESPRYSVKLSRSPVIDQSVSVSVNGEPWTSVVSTSVESPGSKAFESKTTPTGSTIVSFGDGQFGAMVPTDASVVVVYRIGGGEDGNLSVGTLNTSITGLVQGLSNPVTISLTNATSPGQGGRGAETLEEARSNIPYHTRTNDRAVTLDDWQTMAQRFSDPRAGSVAYARASVRTENALLEGNIVTVYAWMTGPSGVLTPLSPLLKTALTEYLQTKAVGTDYVLVFDGTARPAPISLRFKVFDGFDAATTRGLVQDRLRQFVTVNRPGQPLIYSDMVRAIDEVTGVDSVQIATPVSDLIVSNPTELFTPPSADYEYTLTLTEVGSGEYTAQSTVAPLQAWSIRASLAGSDILVIPHRVPGYARMVGPGLHTGNGDSNVSTINLLTGQVRIKVSSGTPGSFKLKLIPVQGYDRERPIDIFVGYVGTNTPEKRAEIRSALRAWSESLGVGSPIYAGNISNSSTGYNLTGISASLSNVAAVVAAVSGVTSVSRVALGTPASSDNRIIASDTELLRLGTVVLNNSAQ